MRLLRVRLEHFRAVEACEIKLDPDGITVISGPNETGKTSLLDAVHFAFTFPDSSKHHSLLAAKPVHRDEGPEVEVEFTTGPYHAVVTKRWLKRPETTLRILAPRPESLTGRHAHDRLEALLDETLDRALFAALQHKQGLNVDQASFAECPSLAAALDAATSPLAARQEADDTLWSAVCRERLRYFTETGRPSQARRELAAAAQQAADRVLELERRMDAVEEDAAAHHRKGLRLGELESAIAVERPRREATEQALAAARALQSVVEAKDTEYQLAAANAAAARKQLAARDRLRDDLERAQAELGGLDEALGAKAAEAEAVEAAATAARAALALARERLAGDQARAEAAAADERYWHVASNLAMYTTRQATVERARQQLRAARLVLDACRLDEALMARLEESWETQVTTRARLQATRGALSIEALRPIELTTPEGPVRLEAGQRFAAALASGSELVIADVARIEVAGAASDRRLEEDLVAAEERFSALLVAAELSEGGGIDAARALDRKRRAALEQERSAGEQIRAALHDLPDVEELERRITAANEQLATILAARPPEPPLPSDREEAARRVNECATALRAAEAAARQAEAALSRAEALRNELTGASAELQGRLSAGRARHLEAGAALAAARQEASDEALVAELEKLQGVEAVAAETLSAARRALEAADLDRALLEYENECALLERLEREAAGLREELARLEGSLERAGEEELAEALDAARTRRGALESEVARTDRLANAAALLWEVFARKREEARRAYVAPYRNALQRLGRLVFGADLLLDLDEQTLQVTERTLGGRTVRFEHLSTGAKEQLAVLSRLACAMIVDPLGEHAGAPVVIDDALGYADEERLQAMALAFSAAQGACQIIVLTCVPERYGRIGTARLVRLDEPVRRLAS